MPLQLSHGRDDDCAVQAAEPKHELADAGQVSELLLFDKRGRPPGNGQIWSIKAQAGVHQPAYLPRVHVGLWACSVREGVGMTMYRQLQQGSCMTIRCELSMLLV
jgi:hypothetical protein